MGSCIIVPTMLSYKMRICAPALKVSLPFIPEHFPLLHNTDSQLSCMHLRLGLIGNTRQSANDTTPSLYPTK